MWRANARRSSRRRGRQFRRTDQSVCTFSYSFPQLSSEELEFDLANVMSALEPGDEPVGDAFDTVKGTRHRARHRGDSVRVASYTDRGLHDFLERLLRQERREGRWNGIHHAGTGTLSVIAPEEVTEQRPQSSGSRSHFLEP